MFQPKINSRGHRPQEAALVWTLSVHAALGFRHRFLYEYKKSAIPLLHSMYTPPSKPVKIGLAQIRCRGAQSCTPEEKLSEMTPTSQPSLFSPMAQKTASSNVRSDFSRHARSIPYCKSVTGAGLCTVDDRLPGTDGKLSVKRKDTTLLLVKYLYWRY